jgi:hypothetical protein
MLQYYKRMIRITAVAANFCSANEPTVWANHLLSVYMHITTSLCKQEEITFLDLIAV